MRNDEQKRYVLYIIFNKENTIKIAKLICTYVPESMQYKLPDEYKDKYDDFVLHRNIEYKSYPVDIKTVRFASDRQMRIRTKYDISVEENSNYMAGGVINGVIVHNSPNVTQGGHALKYYADGRIEMSKTAIKDKVNDRVIGNKTTVKVLKNKTFPPYRKCDFTIIFGKGIDKEEELVSLAEDLGVIVKSGSWFSYKESTIGQGIEGVKSTFEDNPELFELIKNEIIEKIKNG